MKLYSNVPDTDVDNEQLIIGGNMKDPKALAFVKFGSLLVSRSNGKGVRPSHLHKNKY